MLNLIKKHMAMVVFCALYIAATLVLYKNYGLTADEEYRYKRGQELINYIKEPSKFNPELQAFKDPDTYYIYPAFLSIFNPGFSYEIFHLENMLLNLTGFVFLYILAYAFSKKAMYAIIPVLFLAATPVFTGHLAFNPIDMPFSNLYLLTLALIYYEQKNKSKKLTFLTALSIGLTQAIRPLGITLLGVYTAYNLFNEEKSKKQIFYITKKTLFLFALSSIVLAGLWAVVHTNYVSQFIQILVFNSNFSKWDNIILYMGRFIYKDQRPWHFIPTYLMLTIPIYLLVGIAASMLNIKKLLKENVYVLVLISFLGNLGLYLVIQPVIYNTLRHFLFLIPQLVLLSFISLRYLIENLHSKLLRVFLVTAFVINIGLVVKFTIKTFPHEFIYFNELAGGVENAYKNYETEYWGTSYKDSAEWLIDNVQGNPKVFSCALPFAMKYYSEDKYTFTYNIQEADYIVCDYMEDRRRNYNQELVHQVYRSGVLLANIRRN